MHCRFTRKKLTSTADTLTTEIGKPFLLWLLRTKPELAKLATASSLRVRTVSLSSAFLPTLRAGLGVMVLPDTEVND